MKLIITDLLFSLRMRMTHCIIVLPFPQIKNGHDFYSWLEHTVQLVTYHQTFYNGQPTSRRRRKMLADGVSYRVGSVRLRQLRVKPGESWLVVASKPIVYSRGQTLNRSYNSNDSHVYIISTCNP